MTTDMDHDVIWMPLRKLVWPGVSRDDALHHDPDQYTGSSSSTMEFKDYYQILGVEPSADLKTIKTAYRRLARKHHPDLNQEKGAEERFKAVAEAWEVLKDPQKRAQFDELRQYGGQPGQAFTPPPGWQSARSGQGDSEHFSGDFSDFFETLFGAPPPGPQAGRRRSQHRPDQHGQDVEMELPIFLEDTLKDEAKTVRFEIPGTTSQAPESRALKVKIPRGVGDGERIRLKGQGAPGPAGGASGDLYLHIRLVPHPLFDVEGHNLIITIPLAPWEAALGCKITVPTLNGKIKLSVPPNSQSGQRQRIRGKGLAKKSGDAGDLIALFNVVMPPKVEPELEALWRKAAEKSGFNPRKQWSQSA